MTGTPDWHAVEQRLPVAAHGWSLEVVDGSIDHLSWRGDTILRALRLVVRDQDWRTVPAEIESLTVDEGAAETRILLAGRHGRLGVRASWTAALTLTETGLRFEATLTADGAFRRNRIGIVALHSPDLAGRAVTITHPDGSSTTTALPVAIAPHQPAVDIAGLRYDTGGTDVELRFDGDVFEMEDQRNWTDASFKTYGTPLSLPFPVDVAPGDRVEQAVELTVTESSARAATGVPRGEGLIATAARMPRILVGAATAPGRPARRPPWLAGVGVLVELDLDEPGWSRALTRARADAGSEALDIRLAASDPDQLDAVVGALCGVPVVRLGVVDRATHVTTPALWERLRSLAAREPLTGELVGGTRAHFTELNRNHDALPGDLGGVAFSITPQMHDVSTDQVVESLVEQRRVALQAVGIAAGRPVHIGPVTLRARLNAVATTPVAPGPADIDQHGYGSERVWNATDERQTTDEYATWILASAIALAAAGVESVALAEAWGPRGFGTAAGDPYPAASVLQWLAEVQGAPLLPVDAASVPPGVAVLAARTAAGVVVLVANASAAPRSLALASLGADLSLAPWGRARLLLAP
jgi:hypothetical protein